MSQPNDPKSSQQPAGRKSSINLNDLLKLSAMAMCLSVAYKVLFLDAPKPVTAPHAASVAEQTQPPVAVQTDGIRIDPEKVGELLLKRREAVLAAGEVRMGQGQPAGAPQPQATVPSAVQQSPSAAAPQPTQAAPQPAPAVTIAPPGQAGATRVPKVGFYADGQQMTPAEKVDQIKGILAKIPESWTVNWKASDEKASIYVFSDPTCGYCQKLHHAIPELNAAGISVHYFMYPRDMGHNTGVVSKTQENLNNVWCSLDQKAAMDDAYAGYKIPATDCANLPAGIKRFPSPVADHFFLGEMFDVKGTPTIVTSTGDVIVGFGSAESLIQRVIQ